MSPRHLDDLRHRLLRFPEDITANIGAITHRNLSYWLAGLGLSLQSCENFRQALVLLFNFAQRQGYLPDGKTEAQKVERLRAQEEGEIEIFTVQEMQRLLAVARPAAYIPRFAAGKP